MHSLQHVGGDDRPSFADVIYTCHASRNTADWQLDEKLFQSYNLLYGPFSVDPPASSSHSLHHAVDMCVQVYQGVLRSNNKPVAVKVQRPGVRESIALDVYILRWLAGQPFSTDLWSVEKSVSTDCF